LIEFIKSLLLTPFVLHVRPKVLTESPPKRSHLDRYLEILGCVEDLILDHRNQFEQGTSDLSRLSQLVPSIGHFFTSLPLKDAFLYINAKRSMVARRMVAPSFNDVRHLLNYAQVSAIAPTLKLITFDGDMTLYADGADFSRDSKLVHHLLSLLKAKVSVAIVTAAGYGNDPTMYEKRLSGLLLSLGSSELTVEEQKRMFVFGGECSYLFQWDPDTQHLVNIPSHVYQSEAVKRWANDMESIKELLDEAERCIQECVFEMDLNDKTKIIRKERAVGNRPYVIDNLGWIAKAPFKLSREQLDEVALSVQRKLNNYQQLAKLSSSSYTQLPFCAFNGGSDVWVDIGNKHIGVQILQDYLGTKGHETLHLGDQFLSTGNDIATRRACCTVWITNPEETLDVLVELATLL
jgi:IMP and pyridine-specific 5'-nucleotidase